VAHGQGLRPDPEQGQQAKAGNAFTSSSQSWGQSRAFLNAMRMNRRTACTGTRGNLCGSANNQDALLLATAPQAYDVRANFTNAHVVGRVKDQGDCGMW
jgi:hypothetical protein